MSKTSIKLILLIVILCSFLISCAQLNIGGKTHNATGQAQPNTYISSDDGNSVCSDQNGDYSLPTTAGQRTITFSRIGLNTTQKTVTVPEDQNITVNFTFESATSTLQISGEVKEGGNPKAGVLLKLYTSACGGNWVEVVDTLNQPVQVKTCADGKYTFTFPTGTSGNYNVTAALTGCNLTPTETGSITIPRNDGGIMNNFTVTCP
jgi:hypothetical protein